MPNSKNTGAAFSFDLAKDKKGNAVMYVSMIQQHSWNDKTKSGSFKENAKNPEKSHCYDIAKRTNVSFINKLIKFISS